VLRSGDTGAAWSRPSRAAAGEQRTAAIARAPRPAPPASPVPVGRANRLGPGRWPVLCSCAAAACRGSIGSPGRHGIDPLMPAQTDGFLLFYRVSWKAEAFAPICREEYRRILPHNIAIQVSI